MGDDDRKIAKEHANFLIKHTLTRVIGRRCSQDFSFALSLVLTHVVEDGLDDRLLFGVVTHVSFIDPGLY
jgi:hypothetical protein